MSFSVLMSIYKAEKPSYLIMSLNSVLNQTLQASEIIIVEDGPLTTDLYAILDEFESKNPIIRRLRLSENHGLGYALCEGLKYAITEVKFQKELHKIGYLTIFETIRNIESRFFVRVMPVCIRRRIYRRLLR